MGVDLPKPVARALAPLFEQLPIERAMEALVVTHGASERLVQIVDEIVRAPEVSRSLGLVAGLWLYVDELERSHVVSQGMEDATGSFWHGIMHRREGDFSNSHYWFDRVGPHAAIQDIPGYDPHRFVNSVAAKHCEASEDLVRMQRAEWQALIAWCAREDSGNS